MQGLPDMKRWNKITGRAYNKTKSKKKDELGDQVWYAAMVVVVVAAVARTKTWSYFICVP